MMVKNFQETNSIINQYVAEMRNIKIQGDSLRFRHNLQRIGALIGYEISKTLDYETVEVETPLGTAQAELPTEKLVLATILRAGLPLHSGLLDIFDRAENAFISAYRKHHKDGTFEIKIEYVSAPDLEGKTLLLSDSMLATGASIVAAVQHLQAFGTPRKVHIIAVIAAADGVDYVRRLLPEAQIWVGAIDEELTARSYIVPGLGDAGDLAFGEKQND